MPTTRSTGAATPISPAERMGVVRPALLAALLCVALLAHAAAAEEACRPPAQKPMLLIHLFLALDKAAGPAVAEKKWRAFLDGTVTPRFPDGLTVYDAYGQWRNPQTQSISRDATKVIFIAVADAPDIRGKIEEIAAAYRTEFHQRSVGVVIEKGCAAF